MINGEIVVKKSNDEKVTSFSKNNDNDDGKIAETVKKAKGNTNSSSIASARATFLHSMANSQDVGLMKKNSNNEMGKLKTCEIEKEKENKVNETGKEVRITEDQTEVKPHVKLTRKSPYVTTSILKGTPKPVVIVKNKPPTGLNTAKPKVPEKPKVLLSKSFSHNKSPVAAPRLNRLNVKNEQKLDEVVTVSDNSTIEVKSVLAECYSAEADVQNEVIFEVNATKKNVKTNEDLTNKDVKSSEDLTKANVKTSEDMTKTSVKTNEIMTKKNEEALEEIRKSLSQRKKSEEDEEDEEENVSFQDKREKVANSLNGGGFKHQVNLHFRINSKGFLIA